MVGSIPQYKKKRKRLDLDSQFWKFQFMINWLHCFWAWIMQHITARNAQDKVNRPRPRHKIEKKKSVAFKDTCPESLGL